MTAIDDTQPTKAVNAENLPPNLIPPEEDEGGSGPGCFVWSILAGFMIVLGLAAIGLAIFAGWNDGLRTARGNATATRAADIAVQCSFIERDLVAGSLSLAERRLADLIVLTPAVNCVQLLGPTATAVYLQSLPTASPTPSPTVEPEATQPAAEATAEPLASPTMDSSTTGGYDLPALLNEARSLINNGDLTDGIELLDAIQAIDPNFEKATIDQLIYNSLRSEATRLFRGGTDLARAILLTQRAGEYGDVGELNYEAFIAGIYLEAQSYRNVNYPVAIRLLSRIVVEQGLSGYLDASQQLFEQYVNYADALALGGDACTAVQQYNNALNLQASPNVRTKRDNAEIACVQGVTGTPDPSIPVTPGAEPTQGIAPIGVPGT